MAGRGKIVAAYGNMITASFESDVQQNEVAYVITGETRLKSEVIRVRDTVCDMQVFEDTRDIRVGDPVEFTGELLAVELGPGLLQQIYDGLENPLPQLSLQAGLFLKRGTHSASTTGRWGSTCSSWRIPPSTGPRPSGR